MAVELSYCKQNIPVFKKDIDLCNQQIEIRQQQENILTKEKLGLLQDKEMLLGIKDTLDKSLINTSKELTECKENTPSRFVWFSNGVISSLVLILVGTIILN